MSIRYEMDEATVKLAIRAHALHELRALGLAVDDLDIVVHVKPQVDMRQEPTGYCVTASARLPK